MTKIPSSRNSGREITRENPSHWVSCSCSTSWAKSIRDEIWPRPSKGRGHRKKDKFQVMISWVEEQLSSNDSILNDVAKEKYVQLFGELSSQKAWSTVSRRIRRRLSLKCSCERLEENGNVKQVFSWHKWFLKENWKQVFVNTTKFSFYFHS